MFALLSVLTFAGCGVTRLQTARTVPAGHTRATVAVGIIHNDVRDFVAKNVAAAPLDIMIRHGATERMDWGVRTFMGTGALVDVKWNALAPASKTALALSAGLGGAVVDAIGHVPLSITFSHEVLPWFTPYAALGYGTYFIFGYDGSRDPNAHYAARTWTGDGLLSVHVGVELARASGRALMLEYAYARPGVDDPGDFFKFASNHFVAIGFQSAGGGRRPDTDDVSPSD